MNYEITKPWVQTVSGIAFELCEPRVEDVNVGDIAHSLSRIARFNGHPAGEPYSVAHHSMLVADLLASWGAPPAIVREGLLHDAPEAYYGDLTSPLKSAFRGPDDDPREVVDRWERVCAEIDRVVRKALGLASATPSLVRRADLVALAIERRDLFATTEPRDWQLPEYAPTIAPCDRLSGSHEVPTSLLRDRLRASELSPWHIARHRFSAYLAEIDARLEVPA
jgi:5'-deoxynucleotidase YfbR-like HD superfamily hydrolase